MEEYIFRLAPLIIKPSAAHSTARFARLCDTLKPSRTAVNACRRETIESGETISATVKCAKNWIYKDVRDEANSLSTITHA